MIYFVSEALTEILGDRFVSLPATGCTCDIQIDFLANDNKSIMLRQADNIAIKLFNLDDTTTYSEMKDVDYFIKDYAKWMKANSDPNN